MDLPGGDAVLICITVLYWLLLVFVTPPFFICSVGMLLESLPLVRANPSRIVDLVIAVTGITLPLAFLYSIVASCCFLHQGNLIAASLALLAPAPHLIVCLIFMCWLVAAFVQLAMQPKGGPRCARYYSSKEPAFQRERLSNPERRPPADTVVVTR